MNTKEAIERVKVRFDKWALDEEDLAALQALGLADTESEDEKIRKELIEELKSKLPFCSEEFTKHRIIRQIAYLEKQKEQQPAEKLSTEEYVKKFKALCDAYEIKLPNREYDIYGLCEDLHKLFGDIQKPAEWSKEDKVMLNNIIWDVHMKSIKPLDEMDDRSKYEKYEDFLKSLPTRFSLYPKQEWSEEDENEYVHILKTLNLVAEEQETKGYNNLIGSVDWFKSLPERFNLQPKQEWSEEDETHRAFILESLEDQIRFCKKDAEGAYCAKQIRTAQNWLKSLHERFNLQPKQEWSEEDKSTLNRIVEILVECSYVQNWWKKGRLISKEEMEKLVDFLKFKFSCSQPESH